VFAIHYLKHFFVFGYVLNTYLFEYENVWAKVETIS